MAQIKIVETEELATCPYCGKELDKIEKNTKGFLERHVIYRCPYCKKLLSIGNDMGFGG
ncbi:MAG TPA: hypothetical protein PLY70_14225 [Saprospiraceae bacterium]|nr:hypothetical protein [Saprospiraceae bacterium]HPJ16663.1 hypothetical protein [Candidatus Woesebacteria bacterium]